jgi:hypothetical protein
MTKETSVLQVTGPRDRAYHRQAIRQRHHLCRRLSSNKLGEIK